MSIDRPRSSETRDHWSFRNAVRLVLLSAVLGTQSGNTACADPYKEWDNTEYLYKDMERQEAPQPPTIDSPKSEEEGFDFLRETDCTEDTCKFG